MEKRTYKIIVSGRVQGVGYRWFAAENARFIGINGYVKNLSSGKVEVLARGNSEQLERFVMELRKGPSFSDITDIKMEELPDEHLQHGFEIAY